VILVGFLKVFGFWDAPDLFLKNRWEAWVDPHSDFGMCLAQCFGSGSGSAWIRIQLVARIRIRIRIRNADPDPDPGGLKRAKMKKKTQQKAR
jgi:hypothetical protein